MTEPGGESIARIEKSAGVPATRVEPEQSETVSLVLLKPGSGPLNPTRRPGQVGRRLSTSIPLTGDEGRKLAFRCVAGQDWQAEDVLGQPLAITHWLTVDATAMNQETGELQEFVRTVLVTEDGERVSMGSDWVLSSLVVIEEFFRKAPWVPAMTLKIVESKSRNKRRFYSIEPV